MDKPLRAEINMGSEGDDSNPDWQYDTECGTGRAECKTKHVLKHCWQNRLPGHYYNNWTAAKDACVRLGPQCFGVYDSGCDKRGSNYLCDGSRVLSSKANLYRSGSSCVFERPITEEHEFSPSVLHAFWRPRSAGFSVVWQPSGAQNDQNPLRISDVKMQPNLRAGQYEGRLANTKLLKPSGAPLDTALGAARMYTMFQNPVGVTFDEASAMCAAKGQRLATFCNKQDVELAAKSVLGRGEAAAHHADDFQAFAGKYMLKYSQIDGTCPSTHPFVQLAQQSNSGRCCTTKTGGVCVDCSSKSPSECMDYAGESMVEYTILPTGTVLSTDPKRRGQLTMIDPTTKDCPIVGKPCAQLTGMYPTVYENLAPKPVDLLRPGGDVEYLQPLGEGWTKLEDGLCFATAYAEAPHRIGNEKTGSLVDAKLHCEQTAQCVGVHKLAWMDKNWDTSGLATRYYLLSKVGVPSTLAADGVCWKYTRRAGYVLGVENANLCPPGTQTVPEAECKQAIGAVNLEDMANSFSASSAHQYAHGCNVRSDFTKGYFARSTRYQQVQGYALVCKTVPGKSAGSELLVRRTWGIKEIRAYPLNAASVKGVSAECPSGSVQVGAPGTDIAGCGIQLCADRYGHTSIEGCYDACKQQAGNGCRSFSWAATGEDQEHANENVCTLYRVDGSTEHRASEARQLLCRLDEGDAWVGLYGISKLYEERSRERGFCDDDDSGLSEQECKDAASSMGLNYGDTVSWNGFPHKCFKSYNNQVYFNTIKSVDSNSLSSICARSTLASGSWDDGATCTRKFTDFMDRIPSDAAPSQPSACLSVRPGATVAQGGSVTLTRQACSLKLKSYMCMTTSNKMAYNAEDDILVYGNQRYNVNSGDRLPDLPLDKVRLLMAPSPTSTFDYELLYSENQAAYWFISNARRNPTFTYVLGRNGACAAADQYIRSTRECDKAADASGLFRVPVKSGCWVSPPSRMDNPLCKVRTTDTVGWKEVATNAKCRASLDVEDVGTVPQFQRVASGTCAEHGLAEITTADGCATAAAQLGLQDRTVSSGPFVGTPAGCHFLWQEGGSNKEDSLFLNTAPTGLGAEAPGYHQITGQLHYRHLLCERAKRSPAAPVDLEGSLGGTTSPLDTCQCAEFHYSLGGDWCFLKTNRSDVSKCSLLDGTVIDSLSSSTVDHASQWARCWKSGTKIALLNCDCRAQDAGYQIPVAGPNVGAAVDVGKCYGECDSDKQCHGKFRCHARENLNQAPTYSLTRLFEDRTGCHHFTAAGDATYNFWEYCVDPDWASVPKDGVHPSVRDTEIGRDFQPNQCWVDPRRGDLTDGEKWGDEVKVDWYMAKTDGVVPSGLNCGEAYSLVEAKQQCLHNPSCHAITAGNSVCGGQYRLAIGTGYNLFPSTDYSQGHRTYQLDRACTGTGEVLMTRGFHHTMVQYGTPNKVASFKERIVVPQWLGNTGQHMRAYLTVEMAGDVNVADHDHDFERRLLIHGSNSQQKSWAIQGDSAALEHQGTCNSAGCAVTHTFAITGWLSGGKKALLTVAQTGDLDQSQPKEYTTLYADHDELAVCYSGTTAWATPLQCRDVDVTQYVSALGILRLELVAGNGVDYKAGPESVYLGYKLSLKITTGTCRSSSLGRNFLPASCP